MIFATVGTIPYERLINAVDDLAPTCGEKVIIQGAIKNYPVKNAEYHEYLDDIDPYIRNAEIIISHCGVGTIYKILNIGRPAVILPRRAHLGEHYDDHQWEMATKMRETLPFVFVDDITDLDAAINNCREVYASSSYKSTRENFTAALSIEVHNLMK